MRVSTMCPSALGLGLLVAIVTVYGQLPQGGGLPHGGLNPNNSSLLRGGRLPHDGGLDPHNGGSLQDGGIYKALRSLATLPLDFLPRDNVSSQCELESNSVRLGAEQLQLWALKILDASGKVPSGLLSGNVNQFGDFDLCLSAKGERTPQSLPIAGRYCLVEADIKFQGGKWSEIDERLHGYRSMTSNLTDPGQRLPKLGSWRWGVCVPSGCQAEDLDQHLKTTISTKLQGVAKVDLQVDRELCYTAEKPKTSFGHYFAILIFTILTLCVTLGTMWDASKSSKRTKLQSTLTCFSIPKNWAALTRTSGEGEDIAVIHGARAINALGLLLSHKQMALFFNPFVNSIRIGETINGVWSMIGRSAILYTDSFILISGLLTAHSMVKELDRDKKINARKSILSRYLRFTPNLLFVILFCTYLTDFLGPGPQWGLVVTKYSHLCKANMWRNFLYIHNYFGFEEMCLTHTHQLGIDMQLYLVSPLLVYLLWKNWKIGGSVLVAIGVASTWLRYTVTLEKQLSTVIYYGVPVQRLFDTSRYSYILPTHRATVYCMGLLLGYGLRRGVGSIAISRSTAWFGWSVAAAFAAVAMFGPAHMALKGYVYNPMDAAVYNAFAPILWSAFIVWCAVACWNNQGGWFNTVLTWKYFAIFSRISYAFYLVQFPVFFYNVAMQRTSLYYEGFISIMDLKEFAIIFGYSVLLTLAVDMPFQNLKRLVFNDSKSPLKKGKVDGNTARDMNQG